MHRLAAAFALMGLAASGVRGDGAMELNEANFDEQVFKSGKFVFIKFLAPWWGHCKKLKPDWDKLGDLYNKPDSKALIADVDCTADAGKALCEKYGVEGYPTIKYFDRSTSDLGEKYEDARDYNALKKFVKKMSKDPCVLETQANCNKKEKAFIDELASWEPAKITEELAGFRSQLAEAKAKEKELSDMFEKQKDVAMETMKKQEEAKKDLDKLSKQVKYKISILEQKSGGKKDEL